MQPLSHETEVPLLSVHWGFLLSIDDGPNVELSPTTSLGAEIAGAQRASRCLFGAFGRGRGDEFLEARIIPERIEHWIEPK
jgi:hypothetical protein